MAGAMVVNLIISGACTLVSEWWQTVLRQTGAAGPAVICCAAYAGCLLAAGA